MVSIQMHLLYVLSWRFWLRRVADYFPQEIIKELQREAPSTLPSEQDVYE